MRKMTSGIAVFIITAFVGGGSTQAAWLVNTYQGASGTINTITDAETLINSAPVLATASPTTINYNGTFPGNHSDYFAMKATGYVDVVSGTTKTMQLYINSDDGFRLRLNGVTVAEFVGPTSGSNFTTNSITLHDGDFLQLTYFEQAGVQTIVLEDTNGHFLGNSDSGIAITQIATIPEPATASLIGLGAATAGAALWRRRRR